MPPLPATELIENLLPAYSPCLAFRQECVSARWCPEAGFVPRGFLGAIGSIRDVRLVLLTAEPGDPLAAEIYHGSPAEMLEQAYHFYYDPGGMLPGQQRPEPDLSPHPAPDPGPRMARIQLGGPVAQDLDN